jgi:hypothetical protein
MAATTIDAYAEDLDGWRAEVVRRLVVLIGEHAPAAGASIKWAQPVFESDGPFAYIKAFPSSVNLGFWRGVELDDPDGLLEGDGDRMRHVPLRSVDDIREEAFGAFVRQAVELNSERGNPTRRAR